MGKSFSTILLAAGAFVLVAAGSFFIVTMALGSDNGEASTAAASGEQHVYMTNLGMT